MPAFPGPRWTPDQIAVGLVRAGFTGWSVRTMGAITMAESAGYVWGHALNTHESSGVAYLAEGYGLVGMDSYWIMRSWRAGDTTPGGMLMAPYWSGTRTFSQLGTDPVWNLAMTRQVFLVNAYSRGWANAYEGWTSYVNGRHLPFMDAALIAARNAGAI
jgi:hypothetical protein